MALMDQVAGMTGYRYARRRIVTAAVEHMSFHASLHAGDMLTCHTCVNRVQDSAMEVGIRGVEENFLSGKQTHVLTCYMVFVCLDDAGKPFPLPPLEPETDEDRRRMADAARRMGVSLLERKAGFARADALTLRLSPESYTLCRMPQEALPADRLAELFAALADAGTFAATVRDRGEIALLLASTSAEAFQARCPDLSMESGFFRLHLDAPSGPNPAGPFSGVTALLASFGIHGLTVSLSGADHLFLREKNREQAVALLAGAGYLLHT